MNRTGHSLANKEFSWIKMDIRRYGDRMHQ
jgi:hypothetical protein